MYPPSSVLVEQRNALIYLLRTKYKSSLKELNDTCKISKDCLSDIVSKEKKKHEKEEIKALQSSVFCNAK